MAAALGIQGNTGVFKDKEKPMAVRTANIMAAMAVSEAVRTSLGPRGMDKMIQSGKGDNLITNDGNTMLKSMSVMHPAAKMLVDLSAAQDVEAGDGTTSVVVIAGSLLGAADKLLGKGIHPTIISEAFQRAAAEAVTVLENMSIPIDLGDTATLLQAAETSLSSKIVSQYKGKIEAGSFEGSRLIILRCTCTHGCKGCTPSHRSQDCQQRRSTQHSHCQESRRHD